MGSCFVPPEADMARGAYIVADPHRGLADAAVIVDESEREQAMKCAAQLAVCGVAVRLICVSDIELFLSQEEAYQARVLGAQLPLVKASSGHPSWMDKVDAACTAPLDDWRALAQAVKKAVNSR